MATSPPKKSSRMFLTSPAGRISWQSALTAARRIFIRRAAAGLRVARGCLDGQSVRCCEKAFGQCQVPPKPTGGELEVMDDPGRCQVGTNTNLGMGKKRINQSLLSGHRVERRRRLRRRSDNANAQGEPASDPKE